MDPITLQVTARGGEDTTAVKSSSNDEAVNLLKLCDSPMQNLGLVEAKLVAD